MRDCHSRLARDRFRVVAFDQLGTDASDRPDDVGLWTLERYVEEVEIVRTSLGLGTVHLLGQSWGTWLGIEYALTFRQAYVGYPPRKRQTLVILHRALRSTR